MSARDRGLRPLRTVGVDAVRSLFYTAVGVPLGLLYIAVIGLLLSLGLSLSVVAIGLPLVALAVWLAWGAAHLEHGLARGLLGLDIGPLARRKTPGAGIGRRIQDWLASAAVWKAVALVALRLPLALIAALLSAIPLLLLVACAGLGLAGLTGSLADDIVIGRWPLDRDVSLVLLALAVPAAIVSVAALDAAGKMHRLVARSLLTSPARTAGELRATLSTDLGDRSLQIVYWVPERAAYVDDLGMPVELPHAGSGRAWTPVDADGVQVAAIIHDAALGSRADVIRTAASAARLSLENARLEAALRARVSELRASRARIVVAGDEARRRLERDLHDGAQQRLVAVAMELRMLRARLDDDPAAAEALERASGELAGALEELRELARGIHPAVVADRGIGPALDSLARRAPLPVTVEVDVPERLDLSIEVAAYFVAAEALTNVARHAGAQSARATARVVDDALVLEIADDGKGGADAAAGSGLSGLEDRVAALGGSLEVASPPHGGTRVCARFPLHPAAG